MAYQTIEPTQVNPVGSYKLATRMTGGRLLYIAGQVSRDPHGQILGVGDIRAQTRQVFANLRAILQQEGGDLKDLMKITTYLVSLDDFPAYGEERAAIFPEGLPASTLIGVKGLFHPDYLVEVEGIAAI